MGVVRRRGIQLGRHNNDSQGIGHERRHRNFRADICGFSRSFSAISRKNLRWDMVFLPE
jgi:hypothetical protein